MPKRPHEVYVVAPPGIESLTAREVRMLGVKVPVVAHGGLPVRMTTAELYAANLHLRTASRLLVRVARFEAANFSSLARGFRAVAWDRWLVRNARTDVRVDAVASRLHHTGAVAERVRDLLGNLGGATVRVRLDHDVATVSVDSTGEHLHRRGWRLDTAKAPLRETLAAAMLLAIGYDGTRPLVDPMCGSGTIVIEAASIAAGHAPGRLRSFAFEAWPSFDAELWAEVRGRAAVQEHRPQVPVSASDRDAGSVAATLANAARAGVNVHCEVRPLSDVVLPDDVGWIVTNPPYGRRVRGGTDLRDLYDALGNVTRTRASTWGVAVLAADRALASRVVGSPGEMWHASNGGLTVILFARPPTSADPPVRPMGAA